MSWVDAAGPYAHSAEHLLDELALVRAKALARTGGPAPEGKLHQDVIARRVSLSLAQGVDLRLPKIEATFGLTATERAVLLTCLAAEVDPLFLAVCRGLQGEMSGPMLQVATLVELCTGELDQGIDAAMLFLSGSNLRRSALVVVEEPLHPRDVPIQALRCKIDRNLALYLLGERASSAPSWIKHVNPRPLIEQARLTPDEKGALVSYLQGALDAGKGPSVEICGPPGVGRKHLAEAVCHELGRALLVADCRSMGTDPGYDRTQLQARLAEVRRESMLAHALPYLDHYQGLLIKHETARPTHDDQQSQTVAPSALYTIPGDLSGFLAEIGLCFLGGEERFEALADAGEVLRVTLPFPSPRQRAAIWSQVFDEIGAAPAADLDFTEIGRKLALDAQRIHAAARAATATANMRSGGQGRPEVTRTDLLEASKHQLHHDLKSLAVRVDKAYRWEDLVISVDGYHSLMEMIAYAANAEKVYDTWGFGAKHSVATGISALFAGPPGTGKTMCASVIAAELDMELFRVDLSRVVSKWIGETEKNLARVFDEADRSNAVVLFDEADSLFAKRTEVKSSVDRYANLEVNFLLQRMETFNGITILTTNFEDTIDSAFKRRLTFRVRFEKPDADARGALWAKMFPKSANLAGDVDFKELGRRFEVSGGNIRNAAIRAAFLAAAEGHQIDMATLVKATFREAREMGVLIAETQQQAAAPATEADKPPDGDGEPPEPKQPTTDPKKPSPKLVPVTHRR
jgi:SpoVK/Ycf46/Vps4 family AAA+-type ATPase